MKLEVHPKHLLGTTGMACKQKEELSGHTAAEKDDSAILFPKVLLPTDFPKINKPNFGNHQGTWGPIM